MPPAKQRRPRMNPLIPTAPSVSEAPEPIEAPICTQHWPDGWAGLPEGADYASCEHGEWSTTAGLLKRAATEPAHATIYLDGKALHHVPVPQAGQTFPGETPNGEPLVITWRGPGEPALVTTPVFDLSQPAVHVVPAYEPQAGPVSPFRPQAASATHPAGATVTLEPEELNTGEDVMFMPSGG